MSGFLKRLTVKDDQNTLINHFLGVLSFYKWRRRMMQLPKLPDEHKAPFIAYIGAFARPQNIAPLAESLLRTPSIGRIIISENNPHCLTHWSLPTSKRITMLRHQKVQDCHQRHVHLSAYPSDAYLILDDDLFLLPAQIEKVCQALLQDPSSPKGVCGQYWQNETLQSNVRTAGPCDALNRLYAFTKDHERSYFTLVQKLEEKDEWNSGLVDDLVLSLCSKKRPIIIDTGEFIDCTSQGKKEIASWRQPAFFAERNRLYTEILEALNRM